MMLIATIMPKLSLLLLIFLLWGNDNDETTSSVEAFSTSSRTIDTSPVIRTRTNTQHTTIITTTTTTRRHGSVPKNRPTIFAESSTSLTARRSSFGAAAIKLPKVGRDGLYHITTEEEYRSLMKMFPDKLIVLKVFAPWCKTCKALAPKFVALARGLGNKRCTTTTTAQQFPIVWASLAHTQDTNCFVRKTLGIAALPSVQLYAGNGVVVDSFPCGPAKVATILKPKLTELISNHVDLSTGTLKIATASTTTSALPRPAVVPTLSFSNHPLKMLALLCQMLRVRWQQLVKRPGKNDHSFSGSAATS